MPPQGFPGMSVVFVCLGRGWAAGGWFLALALIPAFWGWSHYQIIARSGAFQHQSGRIATPGEGRSHQMGSRIP